jgi:hypothetical protein
LIIFALTATCFSACSVFSSACVTRRTLHIIRHTHTIRVTLVTLAANQSCKTLFSSGPS